MQIQNYFYLVAGILAIIFSFEHFWSSRRFKQQLSSLSVELRHLVIVAIYQPGVVLMLSGIALVEMSFMSIDTSLLAWFIAIVNLGNLMMFFGYSLAKNRPALRKYGLHMGVMALWVGLVVDGIVF